MHPMQSRGFTLIETMVAITVLAIALVGPFVAVRSALTTSYIARDQLTASSLAQEGLEYIRSIRDNNYLASPQRSWTNGLTTFSCYGASPTGYCIVDPTQGDVHSSATAVRACTSIATCKFLYLSSSNLYNQQDEGTETKFKRTLQIREISATEIEITARVEWTTSGSAYSVTVVDIIRDWL